MGLSRFELDAAIRYCRHHIDRNQAELERRRMTGADTSRLTTRLQTLKAIRGAHECDRRQLESGMRRTDLFRMPAGRDPHRS
jgi:hypothetical protein